MMTGQPDPEQKLGLPESGSRRSPYVVMREAARIASLCCKEQGLTSGKDCR